MGDPRAALVDVAELATRWPDQMVPISLRDIAPVVGAALVACAELDHLNVRRITDGCIAVLRAAAAAIDTAEAIEGAGHAD